MKYSQSTGEFYADGLNYPNLPSDAHDITQDQWQTLYSAKFENLQSVQIVPQRVPMWNARRILIENDLLEPLEAYVEDLPTGKVKQRAQNDLRYAQNVERHGELTTLAIEALGLTESQVDALFIAAAELG